VADNSSNYRAILDVFATAKREATWPGATPTLDAVQQALGQLIEWSGVTR
jgi:hypothetical protein